LFLARLYCVPLKFQPSLLQKTLRVNCTTHCAHPWASEME
jgi:hypothetical protein